MDYKKNAEFFNYKRVKFWRVFSYIGYAFYAITAIMLVISGWSMYVAAPPLVLGVFFHMLSQSMMTSEKYIKSQVQRGRVEAKEDSIEALDFPSRTPDNFYKMSGYDLTSDDVLVRKTETFYSTRFILTYFSVEEKKLRICKTKFSLVKEEITKDFFETDYASLSKAKLVTEEKKLMTVDGKERFARIYTFNIYSNDGEVVFSTINYEDSNTIDRLAASINHNIERAKKNA
ncbi:MAG: hypothetical protein IJF55_02085 [Clostridia bacterium]|nr:hypothetical protein [Clostridia bacterium]